VWCVKCACFPKTLNFRAFSNISFLSNEAGEDIPKHKHCVNTLLQQKQKNNNNHLKKMAAAASAASAAGTHHHVRGRYAAQDSQDSDLELHGDEPDLTLVNVPAHRQRKARRSLSDVRNEHLRAGALLLRFELLPSSTEVAAGDVVSAWHHVERFGFMVTADTGCMIPHAQFRPRYGNSKLKLAHICSAAFFRNVLINYKAQAGRRDSNGWPIDLQLSHLCHTAGCCNPQHLAVEERWKNVKRNFCGWLVGDDGATTVCNCGMQPPCVRRYSPSTAVSQRPLLRYDEPRLGKLIRHFVGGRKPSASANNNAADDEDNANNVRKEGTAAAAGSESNDDPTAVVPFTVQVLPADYYVTEEQKTSNRLLRRDRQKKHDQQTAKNKARKAVSDAKKQLASKKAHTGAA